MASPDICSSVTVGGAESDDNSSDQEETSCQDMVDNQAESSSDVLAEDGLKKKKKTRGRVKIGIKLIDQKQKRSATFHKRKSGLMKKGFELSVLTGAEVLVLAAWGDSVFSYSTKKLQRVLTSQSGQELIHHCLRTPAEDVANEEVAMRYSPEGYVVRELSLPKNEKRRRSVMGDADEAPMKRDFNPHLPMHTMAPGGMPPQQLPPSQRPDKSVDADDHLNKREFLTHSNAHPVMTQAQQQPPPHGMVQQGRPDKLGGGLPGLNREEVPGLPVMVPPSHNYPQQHMNTNPTNSYVKPHGMPNRIPSYSDYQTALTNRLVYLPQQQVPNGTKPVPGQPGMLPQLTAVSHADMPGLQAPLMTGASTGGQSRPDSELFGMMPAMIL